MRAKYVALVVALSLIVLSTAGCGGGGGAPEQKKQPIRIGITAPITGRGADYGAYLVSSAKMAVEEINAKGGIDGRLIELFIEDDQSDPSVSVNATKKFIHETKVDMILSSAVSLCTLAQIPVCEQAGMPLFCTVASSPAITKENHPWLVGQMAVPDDAALVAGATYAVRDMGLKKAAILYENSDYGRGPGLAAAEQVKALGGQVVALETVNPTDTDFMVVLSKMKAANPDVMIVMAMPTAAPMIVRQKKQIGLDVPLFVNQGNCSSVFIEQAKEFAEGVYSTGFWSPFATDERSVKFVEAYTKFAGRPPVQACAGTYDGVYLIAEAVKKLGGFDKAKVRDFIRNTKEFVGVAGQYSFNENGRNSMPMSVTRVQGGKWVVVDKVK
ncbi:MAG: ABC transporter substrate-binding protein [Firmicutes bacterium]|jgi:branched-chain amino acid transport system substrate-binding protein|nr:ABC transporter substrate-binding protein [Bacillota bacterium]